MLSDTQIKKAKPGDRDFKLGDSGGLFLLVRPNGSKLWRMKYRIHGKEKLLSFGAYPDLSLGEARDRRDAARKLVKAGNDPAIEKRRHTIRARADADQTFEAVARRWHELQKGRWTPVHSADVLTSLERDVFPDLGPLPIGTIDAPLLLDTLRQVERRGSIETARRLRQRVAAVFDYAISEAITATNPATIVAKALQPLPKKRRRAALTDVADLRTMLGKAEQSGAYPVTLLASRLLALTAVRPGVVRRARWENFLNITWDDEPAPDALWHIPAEQMKLALERKDEEAFDHLVPLTPAAVDVLRAVRRLSGNCELVFPGQRHAHKPLSENAIGYLYNRVGYHGRHVPHGWRAAFSTVMNEWAKKHGRADDRAVIDLMLAHVPKNKVEAAYNRAEYLDRRRQLGEVWADMLTEGLLPAADLLTLARRVAAE